MHTTVKFLRNSLMGLFLGVIGLGTAWSFPTKPVRIVIGFPAGGPLDLHARLLADKLQAVLGQPVLIDYKAGAGGTVGAQEVMKSAPDGHTLMLANTGVLVINPALYSRLPYGTLKDFVPIARTAMQPLALLVNPQLPVRTLQEFTAYVRDRPGQVNYGSAGNGSAGHLAFEYLKMVSDTFVLHVPYRGTGPMLTDLMAGRLQAAAVGAPALLQFIKAGKLRCIATGTTQRLPQLPDVPTVAEQGYSGFEMTQWYGLLAPSKMAKANIDKLEKEAITATRGKIVNDKLSQDTALAVGNTRAEFEAFIKLEQARWKPVIARAQIKPEGI